MKKLTSLLMFIFLGLLIGCNPQEETHLETVERPTLPPTTVVIKPAPPEEGHLTPLTSSNIARVWANEGGDKVTQDELRACLDQNGVLNTAWDGTGIALFGARNEVISFNLVLEAPAEDASQIEVTFTELNGPDGYKISSDPAAPDDLFNYIGRDIELFYVRYLQINGLSTDLAYGVYDERHIPERCRAPFDAEGRVEGTWEDRPCHNKYYPEIAVPIELHTPFTISAGTSQSIWGDIYIPHKTPAGIYNGVISITESGVLTWQVPISVQVRNFELPDLPNARTMISFNSMDVNDRYLGEEFSYPEVGSEIYFQSLSIADRHFQLAHRHKFSLINEDNDYVEVERMADAWIDRLNGNLFTPERGYDGIGVGVGNNIYSIGTYGNWPWNDGDREEMWVNTDAWVQWFDAQAFSTPTDYFLYLIDESDDYDLIERWARWMDENPGPGQRLMSLATLDLPSALAFTPSLDIPASSLDVGIRDTWQTALEEINADPTSLFYYYNGTRPASGSFAIEDDGIALRTLGWIQHKMNIDRWFYWEATYYLNFQCLGYSDAAQTNVFQHAQTYGCYEEDDEILGQAGWNYMNGDGVLMYPGTDTRFPEESYDLEGPIASLRLKLWRRGIQDVDYLVMAAAIDPVRTAEIVEAMIPVVLWEYGIDDLSDPTWVRTDISWSTDPDVWELARAQLADIIEAAAE